MKPGIYPRNYLKYRRNKRRNHISNPRLEPLSKVSNAARIVPATIEFVDIAGLVAGASQGEGLGNQFLAHIRECDAIAQVVREFTDKNIIHVHDSVDPTRDRDVINLELALADLQTITKRLDNVRKTLKGGGSKEIEAHIAYLERVKIAARATRIRTMDDDLRKKIGASAKRLELAYDALSGLYDRMGKIDFPVEAKFRSGSRQEELFQERSL